MGLHKRGPIQPRRKHPETGASQRANNGPGKRRANYFLERTTPNKQTGRTISRVQIPKSDAAKITRLVDKGNLPAAQVIARKYGARLGSGKNRYREVKEIRELLGTAGY